MPRRNSTLNTVISVAVFIVLEAAALVMLSRNDSLQKVWISRAGHAIMGKVWGSTQAVGRYFSLSSANRQLAIENQELLSRLLEAEEKLRRVKVDSMSFPVNQGFSLIPAEVVKISRGKQHNYIILNRGFEDGVQDKSGVITACGVVGVVDAVSRHHSFVFSFQNSEVSISARLGDEGSNGILVWDGVSSNGAILKEVPLQYRHHQGDTVYTSGHSIMFPPDIPIGIVGDSKIVNGATNEISVSLFQDFKALRYVSIVHNNSLDEIEDLQP